MSNNISEEIKDGKSPEKVKAEEKHWSPTLVLQALGLFISASAFVISGLSLALAYASYNGKLRQDEAIRSQTARAVVSEFLLSAQANKNGLKCIAFARSLDEGKLRELFANEPNEISVPITANKEYLAKCINKYPDIKIDNLSYNDVKLIREEVISALNSYDRAFQAVRNEEVNPEDVCNTVFPSFIDEASPFLKKIKETTPLPEDFQEVDIEYISALYYANNPCVPVN